MPDIIILGGPNGAGKTSFANEYFPERSGLAFVNADEIARGLSSLNLPPAQLDLRAARQMLRELDALAAAGAEIMFETTLSTLVYAHRVPDWRVRGYRISLIYLRLPSAERAIERVLRRVAAGGHGVPEETVRRRFHRSLEYLETRYKPIVDEWYVWDSLEGDFRLAAAWDD